MGRRKYHPVARSRYVWQNPWSMSRRERVAKRPQQIRRWLPQWPCCFHKNRSLCSHIQILWPILQKRQSERLPDLAWRLWLDTVANPQQTPLSPCIGWIGQLKNGTIKNLKIADVNQDTDAKMYIGLIGKTSGACTIDNCIILSGQISNRLLIPRPEHLLESLQAILLWKTALIWRVFLR